MYDIGQIRAALNELPFRQGRRQICLGKVSEVFLDAEDEELRGKLDRLEADLQFHQLKLLRTGEDLDVLYVVQELRTVPADLSWMREALRWVSRITTVALEMVLPGLAGTWADRQLGTGFLSLAGFALGIFLGLYHLMAMTKAQR